MNGDVSLKCRVCLRECISSQSVFDFASNKRYSDLLKEYTGTEVSDSDPSKLCNKCASDLLLLVKFVRRFRSTTKKIKGRKIKPRETIRRDETLESKKGTEVKEETEEYSNIYKNVVSEDLGYKKNMLQCLICGVMVQNKSAFLVHYRKHSGEKPCVCKHCGKSFTQSGSLNEHVKRTHEGGREKGYRYTCEACGKQFWRRGALTVHSRIHTKEKPYQCSFCPRTFAQYSEHLLHTRTHTGQRPHACSLCSKAFISHSALRRHCTVHEVERNFACHICQSRLKSKESLKKHILVMHTAEKKNVCDVCGAKFSMKFNLKSHIELRHSDKSGTCTICNKSFSNLQKHLNTHTADTLYTCSICSKKFTKEKALQQHTAKHHTGVASSYPCTYKDCLESFTKQSKLDLHILKTHVHHTPYICEVCSKGFYRLADLRKHSKSAHEQTQNDASLLLESGINDYGNLAVCNGNPIGS